MSKWRGGSRSEKPDLPLWVVFILMGFAFVFLVALFQATPIPGPAPTAPTTMPAVTTAPTLAPKIAPTLDPNRSVWLYAWSAKYGDPKNPILLTSRTVIEGEQAPTLFSCSPAIFSGVDRLPQIEGTCVLGQLYRFLATQIENSFPIKWGEYSLNPGPASR